MMDPMMDGDSTCVSQDTCVCWRGRGCYLDIEGVDFNVYRWQHKACCCSECGGEGRLLSCVHHNLEAEETGLSSDE